MSENKQNIPQQSMLPLILGVVGTLLVLFGSVFFLGKMFAEQPFDKDRIIYYWGNTCPHCKEVKDWMQENDIYSRVEFEEKEVYQSAANAQEMRQAAKICGMTQGSGVPFLYAKGECYFGTPDVISYFEQYLQE